MKAPRLSIDDALLLVVDIQERLMPTISDQDRLQTNASILLRMASLLGLPSVVTEQYPRGLGATVGAVKAALDADTPVFEKTLFSAITPEVEAWIEATGRRQVLVCGIEAHICVLQSVQDLRAKDYEVFLCLDAISAGQATMVAPAVRRMEAVGAVPTGVLSAMYELMGDKQHPAFKQCLVLAKDAVA